MFDVEQKARRGSRPFRTRRFSFRADAGRAAGPYNRGMKGKPSRHDVPHETLAAPSPAAELAREMTPEDAMRARHRFLSKAGRSGVTPPPALGALLSKTKPPGS